MSDLLTTSETIIGRIGISHSAADSSWTLVQEALEDFGAIEPSDIGGVIAATFSHDRRFPSLAVRVASKLGLPLETPAFDLQMACSAYPYAIYLAGKLAADTGRKVLVIDGDAQTPLVNVQDHATGNIFSNAFTVTEVTSRTAGVSKWRFLSRYDEALVCDALGPIRMDGMKVFTFVATEVSRWLRRMLDETGGQPWFVPHQANAYMIRQLAKSLNLTDRLVTLPENWKNPGSCSIPLAIHEWRKTHVSQEFSGSALIAGFGAGYSAATGLVTLA